jgi:hypothetical protein
MMTARVDIGFISARFPKWEGVGERLCPPPHSQPSPSPSTERVRGDVEKIGQIRVVCFVLFFIQFYPIKTKFGRHFLLDEKTN